MINADKAYDSKEIMDYNRTRGIITNVPVNNRNRKKILRLDDLLGLIMKNMLEEMWSRDFSAG